MTFNEAKQKSKLYYFIGYVVMLSTILMMIITLLKGIYYIATSGVDHGFISGFYNTIANLVSFLYYQPLFPVFLWKISPNVNMFDMLSLDNWPLIILYLSLFLGVFFISAGRELSLRVKKVKAMVEDEIMAASLRGEPVEPIRDNINNVPIKKEGVYSKLHSLYLAPLIVGLVLFLIGKM